ncbi:uncharacterized protein MYCFIDRAFT_178317 [Pseudocercospora fijiensis CIRAD86]|uniref:Uncharacterized protein n=1 Tax=Pseudocercospora fijiensis (strain CIRAD86) TaxID=383855 RepID=M3ARS3_PSEFD|nr:uncharacterized protein MYCFIDRAFT_178317 [Pseudocercospora fijiensis CIRAD86]EME79758.1 hypothetical protein MYCFIDRAFT_178317 [Pseudocercospora fijiensis CIRAD86]
MQEVGVNIFGGVEFSKTQGRMTLRHAKISLCCCNCTGSPPSDGITHLQGPVPFSAPLSWGYVAILEEVYLENISAFLPSFTYSAPQSLYPPSLPIATGPRLALHTVTVKQPGFPTRCLLTVIVCKASLEEEIWKLIDTNCWPFQVVGARYVPPRRSDSSERL